MMTGPKAFRWAVDGEILRDIEVGRGPEPLAGTPLPEETGLPLDSSVGHYAAFRLAERLTGLRFSHENLAGNASSVAVGFGQRISLLAGSSCRARGRSLWWEPSAGVATGGPPSSTPPVAAARRDR